MNPFVETKQIHGKTVYIFEQHHYALFPWAQIRRGNSVAPMLITLDHHTDTMQAYRRYACRLVPSDMDAAMAAMRQLQQSPIDWASDEAVNTAVQRLKHDEHIHAAILSGVIDTAFAINLGDQTPSIEERGRGVEIGFEDSDDEPGGVFTFEVPDDPPPTARSYIRPETGAFEISGDCVVGCGKSPHDDDCWTLRCDEVLESSYLNRELATADVMAETTGLPSPTSVPYILDIDLDYFHSEKSVEPDDPTRFYRLMRESIAITVAKETQCVESLRLEGSTITSDFLRSRLLAHIEQAMVEPDRQD